MRMKLFEEFKRSDLEPLSSFRLHDSLNPKIWDGFNIKPDVKRTLMEIATEYFNSLEEDAEIYDVILTGSLANFNWSEYSDYDLHILIDFKDVNEDVELVKKFVDLSRKVWNDNHDIKVEGFEVEVYIQEKDEDHTASGIYSLMKDRWLVRPTKQDFKPDEEAIKMKGIDIMKRIDAIEEDLNNDFDNLDKLKERDDKIWDKIKKMRKEGLEQGEFGLGNLVFKFLRRNSYIGTIIDLRTKIYDLGFSS